jgi:hypothetical protein
MNEAQRQHYNEGRQAYKSGHAVEACSLGKLDPLRAWWIAGYYDMATEVKARVSA